MVIQFLSKIKVPIDPHKGMLIVLIVLYAHGCALF